MRLSTKCSLALHCLIAIGEFGEQKKVTSELLAKSTGCNAAAIRSILSALQRANIIAIARGVGGAHLCCDPEKLTLWEIYHALEPDGLEHFIGLHPTPSMQCPVGQRIQDVLKKPYAEIGNAVKSAMENITLKQVWDDYRAQ